MTIPAKPAGNHDGQRAVTPRLGTRSKSTTAYSKWFGRFLTKLSITSPQKVFHSFRHTFKDACRNCGVSREMAEVLRDHAGRTVGDSYGTGYSLAALALEVRKISFGTRFE